MEQFTISNPLHTTKGFKVIPNVNKNDGNGFGLSISKPTLLDNKVRFGIEATFFVIKNKVQVNVIAENIFEIHGSKDLLNTTMDLKNDATISQITHLAKTTIDYAMAYYFMFSISTVQTTFPDSHKNNENPIISVQVIRPQVAAILAAL